MMPQTIPIVNSIYFLELLPAVNSICFLELLPAFPQVPLVACPFKFVGRKSVNRNPVLRLEHQGFAYKGHNMGLDGNCPVTGGEDVAVAAAVGGGQIRQNYKSVEYMHLPNHDFKRGDPLLILKADVDGNLPGEVPPPAPSPII
jgi:hypothetical protein